MGLPFVLQVVHVAQFPQLQDMAGELLRVRTVLLQCYTVAGLVEDPPDRDNIAGQELLVVLEVGAIRDVSIAPRANLPRNHRSLFEISFQQTMGVGFVEKRKLLQSVHLFNCVLGIGDKAVPSFHEVGHILVNSLLAVEKPLGSGTTFTNTLFGGEKEA